MFPQKDIKHSEGMVKIILENMRKIEKLWVRYHLTPVCYGQ